MGEVPNMVTYEVHTLHEGFVADVQVGDGFHFRSARPAATVARFCVLLSPYCVVYSHNG